MSELPPEPMRQFEAMTFNEDHEEALRINELFDVKKADGLGENALAAALATAETEFTEKSAHLLGISEFGYSVTKNAFRWWRYSTAYLEELTRVGFTDQLQEQQIDAYGEEKYHAGDKLLVNVPSYFRTFDLLEKERIRRSQAAEYLEPADAALLGPLDQAPVHPFELGKDYAALALAKTLELAFESSDETLDIEITGQTSHYGGATYFVEKPPRNPPNGPAYIITRYPDGQDFGETQDTTSYIVEMLQTPASQEHAIVMEVQAGRLAEACTSLDLVEAVAAEGGEARRAAAFERMQATLVARRETS